jgi:hypothetical protein
MKSHLNHDDKIQVGVLRLLAIILKVGEKYTRILQRTFGYASVRFKKNIVAQFIK